MYYIKTLFDRSIPSETIKIALQVIDKNLLISKKKDSDHKTKDIYFFSLSGVDENDLLWYVILKFDPSQIVEEDLQIVFVRLFPFKIFPFQLSSDRSLVQTSSNSSG